MGGLPEVANESFATHCRPDRRPAHEEQRPRGPAPPGPRTGPGRYFAFRRNAAPTRWICHDPAKPRTAKEVTMSAEMDQLIAQFETFQSKVRQAEARFAGVGDMQDRIAQVGTSVTSPDGTVTVTAGAGGTVTDLRLTAGA